MKISKNERDSSPLEIGLKFGSIPFQLGTREAVLSRKGHPLPGLHPFQQKRRSKGDLVEKALGWLAPSRQEAALIIFHVAVICQRLVQWSVAAGTPSRRQGEHVVKGPSLPRRDAGLGLCFDLSSEKHSCCPSSLLLFGRHAMATKDPKEWDKPCLNLAQEQLAPRPNKW